MSSWICVSLRMAASAAAPSAPMSLPAILQAKGRMGTVSEGQDVGGPGGERPSVSMGTATKANTTGAAVHLRWEIIVSLRIAASVEAPSAPMLLPLRLRARCGMGMVRE